MAHLSHILTAPPQGFWGPSTDDPARHRSLLCSPWVLLLHVWFTQHAMISLHDVASTSCTRFLGCRGNGAEEILSHDYEDRPVPGSAGLGRQMNSRNGDGTVWGPASWRSRKTQGFSSRPKAEKYYTQTSQDQRDGSVDKDRLYTHEFWIPDAQMKARCGVV